MGVLLQGIDLIYSSGCSFKNLSTALDSVHLSYAYSSNMVINVQNILGWEPQKKFIDEIDDIIKHYL